MFSGKANTLQNRGTSLEGEEGLLSSSTSRRERESLVPQETRVAWPLGRKHSTISKILGSEM